MDKVVRESLEMITDILDLLNNNIEELDKRVSEIEDNIEDEYITIRIHKNASNFDVLRKVFGCKIDTTQDNDYGVTHLDLDDVTAFNTKWLKHKFFVGDDMSDEEYKKKFGIFS